MNIITVKKNSKEFKNVLNNLTDDKIQKWIYPNGYSTTKEEFINFFKKEYGIISIEKYDTYYSVHTGLEYYRISI